MTEATTAQKPYVRHMPVYTTRDQFDPRDITTDQYKHFDKDASFAQVERPYFKSYEDLRDKNTKDENKQHDFRKIQWTYKRDENEPGFAPGMDDLARIILDNKSNVKFNKKLTTENGALYWVNMKNKGKEPKKHWSVVVYDLNQDGKDEVLILDARKDIRYINGFHVGKKNLDVTKAHQLYIDKKYGNPSQIAAKRRKGEIAPGELSFDYWLTREATAIDENNPLGPLKIVSPELKATEYKTRPMNPCNMFLKFLVKDIYDEQFKKIIESECGHDTPLSKAIKRVASIIPLNAELYANYIANPSYDDLYQKGYTRVSMRKKYPGKLQTPFSEACAKRIKTVAADKDSMDDITAYIAARLTDAKTMVSQKVNSVHKVDPLNLRKDYNQYNDAYIQSWLNTPSTH